MILTIDIGNTRIKCAQWCNDIIVNRSVAVYEEDCSSAFQDLFSGVDKPSRIYAVSVVGKKIQVELDEWVMRCWQLEVEYLHTQQQFKNIVNAYDNPEQHGVDRWVGMIAAYQCYPQSSTCVIGAGTATTFDLINKNGRHLGGYILPSYLTMRSSLIAGAVNVLSVVDEVFVGNVIPNNTNDAVNQGCHKLLRAGLQDICESMKEEINGPLKIVITGGNAETILKYPGLPDMLYMPDLIFQGIYSVMQSQNVGVD